MLEVRTVCRPIFGNGVVALERTFERFVVLHALAGTLRDATCDAAVASVPRTVDGRDVSARHVLLPAAETAAARHVVASLGLAWDVQARECSLVGGHDSNIAYTRMLAGYYCAQTTPHTPDVLPELYCASQLHDRMHGRHHACDVGRIAELLLELPETYLRRIRHSQWSISTAEPAPPAGVLSFAGTAAAYDILCRYDRDSAERRRGDVELICVGTIERAAEHRPPTAAGDEFGSLAAAAANLCHRTGLIATYLTVFDAVGGTTYSATGATAWVRLVAVRP
jgi:hypothetical protein